MALELLALLAQLDIIFLFIIVSKCFTGSTIIIAIHIAPSTAMNMPFKVRE